MKKNFQTPLYKTKGLGSGNNGVLFWLTQHLTATFILLVIPRAIYLFCWTVAKGDLKNGANLSNLIHKPLNVLILWLFLLLGLSHGAMGFGLVLEDYVEPKCIRVVFKIGFQLITAVTIIALTAMLYKIH
ncbi:Succinate dehydrogenase hydrophobic membrane anchor subunit [Candidatus Xenohaliotis californiensis]|uniref:Succinate dehydrogenase hydrophobic membrane anchor subunit n=1 Tax=Candidatus Xenohaliotis californiensis TaxID=84677 RepID=A0ABM9N7T0_9RICK|nr:Succinate dehydrogenase hydrophobic membrane anchor subunit [Candidatus Xenohaliotis californiensis]